MIIGEDITGLNTAVNDDLLALLLLSGSQPSTAASVHDYLEINDALEDFQQCFLITKLDKLSQQRQNDWFAGASQDRYAVLRGPCPKGVTCTGPVSDLLGDDGKPSIIEILFVLSKGGK
jgi:hypothetical protein